VSRRSLISRTLSEFIVGLADSYPGRCPGLEFANAFGVHAFSTADSPSMLIPFQGRVAGTTTIVRCVATIEKARFSRSSHRCATPERTGDLDWSASVLACETEQPRGLRSSQAAPFGAWARLIRRYASLSSKTAFATFEAKPTRGLSVSFELFRGSQNSHFGICNFKIRWAPLKGYVARNRVPDR
jgi:hypothetical protein